MGLSHTIPSRVYSVPVSPPTQSKTGNERSPEYRNPHYKDKLIQGFENEKPESLWDFFQLGARSNPEGPCIGTRHRDASGALGDYEWITYKTFEEAALQLGRGITQLSLVPELYFEDEAYPAAQTMKIIGVFSKNCYEWLLLEQAANAFGFVLVPLYETLGLDTMRHIIKQTKMEVLFVSPECLPTITGLLQTAPSLKKLVVMGEPLPSKERSEAAQSSPDRPGVQIMQFSTLLEAGKDVVIPLPQVTRKMVHTLCYTSGTTGAPKGVVITHGSFLSTLCALMRMCFLRDEVGLTKDDVHLSYLPLAHILERSVCNMSYAFGASIGIFSGQASGLMDDIKALNPTFFTTVPRLLQRLDNMINKELSQKSYARQFLFHRGLQAKLESFRQDGSVTHSFWDPLIFNKTRALFGTRLRFFIVGGAALDPQLNERTRVYFCCPLMQGYGLTEISGVSNIARPLDPSTTHVGGPIPSIELCVESIPEMNHSCTGKPPSGELLIRGEGVSKGYFRNPEETKKVFDEDGWFHSGDVVQMTENGCFKIVDRIKNIFKLAQGEYVSPEKVEAVYNKVPVVSQIYVHGDPHESVLVAVVVPDDSHAKLLAEELHLDHLDLPALIKENRFKERVLMIMNDEAKNAGLKGFEKVKNICMHLQPFTIENSLLTATMKVKRFDAKKKFAREVEGMYAQLKGDDSRRASGEGTLF